MDAPHQKEYHIRDVDTRSVTLFPARAQIIREIKDVPLRPGANQITIVGLSPTVDEHSIKVEGVGSAVLITDIAVESRPNRDIFQDIFPESDQDSDDNDQASSDEDMSDEAEDADDPALKDVREKITALRDEEKRAKEIIASAESRLKILDSYGKLLTTDSEHQPRESIHDGIETYRSEREKVFKDHMAGIINARDIAKQIADLDKEEKKLLKIVNQQRAKAEKAKAKARRSKKKEEEKEARRRAEILKEKNRVRREHESFWPKNVFVVKVSLDASAFTPMTSRRSSVSSDLVKLAVDAPEPGVDDDIPRTCDLTITYLTTYAHWSPSYDLALSTTTSQGNLCFDARLTNMTSETWSNCKVILSTSQADFSDLNDKIPTLVPWRVRLGGKGRPGSYNDIMYSQEEKSQKAGWLAQQNARSIQRPHHHMFGVESGGLFGASIPAPAPAAAPPPKAFQATAQRAANPSGSLFGSSHNTGVPGGVGTTSGGLFGSASATQQMQESVPSAPAASRSSALFGGSGGGFGSIGREKRKSETEHKKAWEVSGEPRAGEEDAATPDAVPELGFQESSFEETGLTSTYELPGLKTLAPSHTASKQRVARITFANVTLSHTVVAKYKPAAYLKAKLRNGSKLTLLRGPAGLTLDGSFIGRTDLPRCSPGDSFSLSLGVDPAIRVTYPKPDVKRSQSGLFTKEDSGVYNRTITISNTRSGEKGKPVQLTVLDQVPVSEDEKLRIEILQPVGLTLGSSGVTTGVSGREGKDEKDWGKAVASLKKGGEVSWSVTLNAGRVVKLGLAYECSFPTGDHVVNV
ncbi:hypothetical protein JX265_011248 [Neoarthrinium moseri]|uniref:Mucoidy inhibitor-like protein n=1 Tax=Neoarthrinium moseri TaxID=1658444 RepID=A0A9P9WD42_9PEZI|nr:uncharacterized protein JN550_010554 [Neoarthrinium moseri]KAI1857513.1 hypothetical protein JX265_011248 [Neoarthrinium moseri]KAI1862089.1 hypothetical protein JN550_010554 [Neoarthrinium moseri]